MQHLRRTLCAATVTGYLLIASVPAVLGIAVPGCAGGVPINSFRLLVEPPKGGPAIPVTSVNVIRPGDKLKYEPIHLPAAAKHKGRIALMLIPAGHQSSNEVKVLDPKPA